MLFNFLIYLRTETLSFRTRSGIQDALFRIVFWILNPPFAKATEVARQVQDDKYLK